jgi:hypothetical protein
MPGPFTSQQVRVESDGTPQGTHVYVNGEQLKWVREVSLHFDPLDVFVVLKLNDGATVQFDGPMNRRPE